MTSLDDLMEGVRGDFSAIENAVARGGLGVGRTSADDSGHSQSDGGARGTVAGGLLSKAERITEIGMQETIHSVLRNLEGRLERFSASVAQVEQCVRDVHDDTEAGLSELRTGAARADARASDAAAAVAKLKARAATQDEGLREHGASIEALTLASEQLQKTTQKRHEHHDAALGRIEDAVAAVAARQDTLDAKLGEILVRLDSVEKVERKTEELDRYNVEFMELSKRSTASFEAELDRRLSSLDGRYASLLKHYHASVMQHVAGIVDTVETKNGALQSQISGEVSRLAEDVSGCQAATTANAEKLSSEVKTLNRRLLSGIKLLKEHHTSEVEQSERLQQQAQPQTQKQPPAAPWSLNLPFDTTNVSHTSAHDVTLGARSAFAAPAGAAVMQSPQQRFSDPRGGTPAVSPLKTPHKAERAKSPTHQVCNCPAVMSYLCHAFTQVDEFLRGLEQLLPAM